MPPAEARMWTLLRGLKPLGFHFRRQVPIGRYYADFVCHHASLVIEIDGGTHGADAAMRYDAARDDFIRAEGYDIVRIWNHDVMENLDGVMVLIEAELAGRLRTPTLDPSPQGGGRRRGGEGTTS
jgi:very-short-patch-repair endonuclease